MPHRGTWSVWCLTNDRSDGLLSDQQEMLAGLMHESVAPLIGTRLCAAHQRSLSGLSKRRREVLTHLLAGRTEKEIAVVGQEGIFLSSDGGENWKRVDRNLNEWLYAIAFADSQRGYIVGARGLIMRTDDGGATWKDLESGVVANLFGVATANRNEALAVGDQGKIIATKDGGQTWSITETITSSSLFSIAYRGGTNVWVAGRGGAILRRTDPVATVSLPVSRLPPLLKGGAAKIPNANAEGFDDGDIPLAQPPKKP